MAVAFDAVGSATGFTSTTTTLSWTHTAGAGGSTVIVGIAWGSTSFPPTVSAITYGGNAMSPLPSGGQSTDNVSGNGGVLLYGITGQASGANTVSITFSGAPTSVVIGNSASFTGAIGFGTPVKAFGLSASASVTVAGTTAGNLVAAVEAHGTNGTATYTSGTKQFDDEVNAASGAGNLSCGTIAAGGSVSVTTTITSDVWGMIGVEVQAAAAPLPPPLSLAIPPGLGSPMALAPWNVPLPPSPAPGPPNRLYIAGMTGSGVNGYFTDQNGQPRFMLLEQAWALPSNAGRWNGGNWQGDMDAYFQARGSQGYTAWFGTAWSDDHVDSTALSGGRTWDGIYPITVNGTPGKITTGTETITLNNAFWTRIDYLFASAKLQGISCFLNLGMQYDFSGTNNIFFNLSTTQANTFGNLIATRYPQSSYPHVFFFFGDDGSGGQDTYFTQMLSGIQGTGDTRNLISSEQLPETNSHIEFDTGAVFVTSGFSMASSTYNWTYTYDPTYLGIEKGYTETGTTLIPVVYGDGIWYGDTDNSTPDYTIRRVTWWALSSGVRGLNNTSGPTTGGDVWQWQTNAVHNLTSDPNGPWITGHIGNLVSFFTGLTNWQKLVPDTGNVFITAGRGTKSTNDAPGFNAAKYGDTDTYVSGSRVSDGSLAVVYCGQHFSITIDQTKLGAGYTATWVDPASLATTPATTGTTYNSTPLGNNSAGNPDWALVFQAPVAPSANLTTAQVTIAAPAPAATVGGTTVSLTTAQVTINALAPSLQDKLTLTTAQVNISAPAPSMKSQLGLAVAQVTINAPAPALKAQIALTTAQVTINAPAPAVSTGTTVSLTRAQVTVAAPAPASRLTLTLGVAQVTINAPAPTIATGVTASLTTAHLTLSSPVPSPKLSLALAVARVTVAALAVAVQSGNAIPPLSEYAGGSASQAATGGGATESQTGGTATTATTGGQVS